jgi:hypothetical protein
MATPQAPIVNNGAPAKPGPIDQKDVDDWMARFNEHLAHTDQFTAPAPADSREWHAGLFGCFNPIDTCKLSYNAMKFARNTC